MYKVRTSIFKSNIQYLIVRAKSVAELSPAYPAYLKPSQQMAAQMELTQGEELWFCFWFVDVFSQHIHLGTSSTQGFEVCIERENEQGENAKIFFCLVQHKS